MRPASARRGVVARAPRGVLGLIALTSLAALALALIAQHGWDMQPCPWCIFQRVIYLGIAGIALAGWLLKPRWVAALASAGVLLLAAGGVAAAIFQHRVAAKDSSCAFTLADRFLSATGLEAAVPWLFAVTATCADAAAARVLGLGFEIWSGLLFVLLAVAALGVLRAGLRG